MVYEELADALGNARMPNHMIDLAADIERAASTRGEPKLLLVDHRRTSPHFSPGSRQQAQDSCS